MQITSSTTLGDLAYRTFGEGRTSLVLMHGWSGSSGYFEPLIEHLDPNQVHSITLDLPGHGRSAPPPSAYTLDLVADAVITAADAAGADTFVLLGFSMSGKFAQYVTHRHRDRVLGQILVAGCPAGRLPLPAELIDDWCSRAGDAEGLIEIARSCTTRPVPAATMDAFGRDAALISELVLRQTVELCAAADFAADIAGTSTPTLVVAGSGDWLFPPDALRGGVVAPLANARLEALDCGHEIPIEATQELAALVADFIHHHGSAEHADTAHGVPTG